MLFKSFNMKLRNAMTLFKEILKVVTKKALVDSLIQIILDII